MYQYNDEGDVLKRGYKKHGFTLIELSIVLVIIGLVVGGILTGRDLISAAEVRAQITQIEKYNSAANTFRGKYGGIPGDLQLTVASQFGFDISSCLSNSGCDGVTAGERNGNGLIDGLYPGGGGQDEAELFWEDLSSGPHGAGLIEGMLPLTVFSWIPTTPVNEYLPAAKIGYNNFISVFEANGFNWYALSALTPAPRGMGIVTASATLPVRQAYALDKKIDDGLPMTGNAQAAFVTLNALQSAPNNATSGGDSTTCYDTTTGTYSVTINNGSGANCALSFKMQ